MNGTSVGNPIATPGTALTKEQLDRIIEEIALYEINLESDPTLPNLGTRYLQQVITTCRAYSNRVQFYLQIVKLHEKRIRLDLRHRELDLEFKMKEKLADDPIVRKQPSVRDRESVAATMLATEHHMVSALKVELLDIEETVKLIRSKYDQLKQTSNDIRMQRVLIKDDKEAQMLGGEGYTPPQTPKNRMVPDRMPAAIAPLVEPADILDPTKRPDDMPEPLDAAHASMMADFLNAHPTRANVGIWHCDTCGEAVTLAYRSPLICPNGHRAVCAECGCQQLLSPSGNYDEENGHGGTPSRMVNIPDIPEASPEPEVPMIKPMSYRDLLED